MWALPGTSPDFCDVGAGAGLAPERPRPHRSGPSRRPSSGTRRCHARHNFFARYRADMAGRGCSGPDAAAGEDPDPETRREMTIGLGEFEMHSVHGTWAPTAEFSWRRESNATARTRAQHRIPQNPFDEVRRKGQRQGNRKPEALEDRHPASCSREKAMRSSLILSGRPVWMMRQLLFTCVCERPPAAQLSP